MKPTGILDPLRRTLRGSACVPAAGQGALALIPAEGVAERRAAPLPTSR
jgi:hypothetical protein